MKTKLMIEYIESANLLMERDEYTDAFILFYICFERQCRKLIVVVARGVIMVSGILLSRNFCLKENGEARSSFRVSTR